MTKIAPTRFSNKGDALRWVNGLSFVPQAERATMCRAINRVDLDDERERFFSRTAKIGEALFNVQGHAVFVIRVEWGEFPYGLCHEWNVDVEPVIDHLEWNMFEPEPELPE